MTFLSGAAAMDDVANLIGLQNKIGVVKDTRNVTKKDMVLNNYQPNIDVDPETYEVRVDGELITCEPAAVLPMAQRYFLF